MSCVFRYAALVADDVSAKTESLRRLGPVLIAGLLAIGAVLLWHSTGSAQPAPV